MIPRHIVSSRIAWATLKHCFKKNLGGQAREVTRRLRALAVLAEDQSLIPSTHNSGSQHLCPQLQGVQHPLLTVKGTLVHVTQGHTRTKTTSKHCKSSHLQMIQAPLLILKCFVEHSLCLGISDHLRCFLALKLSFWI